MRCRIIAVAAALAGSVATVHARPEPVFRLVARSGDAFPGRPGASYDVSLGNPFIGARPIDPSGDLYFTAFARLGDGSRIDDILVYRRATGTVEPYVHSENGVGALANFWGVVGGWQAGTMTFVGELENHTASERLAVLVQHADGTRVVAAEVKGQVPGQPAGTTFTTVGRTSAAFMDVNMNATGVVSYGGQFTGAGGSARTGYYITRPGGAPERIIDSTMPVPNRSGATWVNYDGIGTPFDIYTPGLDDNGDAYFKAKYRLAGKDYRAFYKRTSDGAITAIVDGADANAVPGLPGHGFSRISTSANNRRGDVAMGAEITKPDGSFAGTGVFAARAGGAVSRLLTWADPVPGIPEAVDHSPNLIAMSNTGHILVTDNYFLTYPTGKLGGQSLVLFNPDGTATPVLKFNETPGFPGQRAGLTTAADLNSRGDAVFITRMNMTGNIHACFAYLHDTGELVPILKSGDTLLGKTVVIMSLGGGANDPLGSIGASAGPVSWDDARNLSLNVTLRDAAGNESYAIYAVQVPAPAIGAVLTAVPVFMGRRRS
ncbi:MAG: hypothetical protein L6Q35_09835 [Phycisphaerales bacterium]|nr:hypothetical protein [Phycisphaerales bacterium]